jgi:hypothetical protein
LPLELPHVGTWRANLAALQASDVAIGELLASARRPGKFLRFSELAEGAVEARSGAEVAVLRDPVASLDPNGSGPVVLQGAGTGQTIDRLLAETCRTLWVFEPEGHLASWLLCRFDWSGPIADGRITWRVPALEMAELAEVSLQSAVAEAQRHLCGPAHACWLPTGSTALHAAFQRELQTAADIAEDAVERARSWPPAAASEADVTVVSPHCAIFDELAECFRRLGLQTRLLHVPDRPGDWSRIRRLHLLRTLRESPSRVVLLRNRCLLETTNARERVDALRLIPGRVVSWWWDVPNVASVIDLAASAAPLPALAMAREMLGLLPAGSRWLPAGARLSCCEGTNGDEPPLPLTFVGQSRFPLLQSNLSTLANALATYVGAVGTRLAEHLNRARGLPAIHALLRDQEADLRAAIDSLPQPMAPHAYYLHYLLSMSQSAAFRMAAIAGLAKLPLVVFGDSAWVDAGIVPRDRYGGLLRPERLPGIYRSSRLNLNFNFMQVSSAVNPKVLDVAAAGGAVLTDPRPELSELFPDPATRPSSFESIEQLADVAADLLRTDLSDHRARLQQHVRAQHTLMHRALWLARDWGLVTP